MRLPDSITFTGIDAHTDPEALNELAALYPVEFGVLVSDKRVGTDDRYPADPQAILNKLADHVRVAVHVCGAQAREITDTGSSQIVVLAHPRVRRIQINTILSSAAGGALAGILRAATLGAVIDREIIFQARGNFPDADTVQGAVVRWLFDQSGGRGETPTEWPLFHINAPKWIGYAGGLNQDNVKASITKMTRGWPSGVFDHQKRAYWIDMESGVRTNSRFDIEKCRAVCQAVYERRT